MQVSELVFPMEVSWLGDDYTLAQSAMDEDSVDAYWHPKDTPEDRDNEQITGTIFYADQSKAEVVHLINKGCIVVKGAKDAT